MNSKMTAGAQLTVTDLRRAVRHPVTHRVIGEHRVLGDVHIEIVNLSAHGFMSKGDHGLGRGDRVIIRLPVIGRIEAHMIWMHEGRSGFQFERIIRTDDFLPMLDEMQPNPRLRGRR